MQDTPGKKPLQGGPDATAGLALGSVTRNAHPDAPSRAPQLVAAPGVYGTRSDTSAGTFGAGSQEQAVHTDVMPSKVLGWPPKQAVPAPAPSADSDIPGANGAADYKPAPPPDAYQACLPRPDLTKPHMNGHFYGDPWS